MSSYQAPKVDPDEARLIKVTPVIVTSSKWFKSEHGIQF